MDRGLVHLLRWNVGRWRWRIQAHLNSGGCLEGVYLQSLTEYPENVGALRNPLPNHGKWAEHRRKEMEFEGVEPYVVIIGAGQSGLGVGARLKFLDIPTLILDRNPRVGDQWRNRYEALCLHDPVCTSFYSIDEYPPVTV